MPPMRKRMVCMRGAQAQLGAEAHPHLDLLAAMHVWRADTSWDAPHGALAVLFGDLAGARVPPLL